MRTNNRYCKASFNGMASPEANSTDIKRNVRLSPQQTFTAANVRVGFGPGAAR